MYLRLKCFSDKLHVNKLVQEQDPKSMKKIKLKTQKKIKKSDLIVDQVSEKNVSSLTQKGEWIKYAELFEFQPKNRTVTLRMPEAMLKNLKTIANDENLDYQKLIRKALSELIAKKRKTVA